MGQYGQNRSGRTKQSLNTMYYKTTYDSPIGSLLLVSNGTTLNGLWMEQQKYYGAQYEAAAIMNPGLPVFAEITKWLDAYFAGSSPDLAPLSLVPVGTPFQQWVWNILQTIPYGTTITYGEIAARIAQEQNRSSISAQAVGNAVGRNPISIIIPCHRVIGSNGSLTGYAGGLERKLWLLQHEGILL